MLKINNKGQSLVMFALIIPIFLLILTLVYDVGNAIYEKDRLSNTNYLTIEYIPCTSIDLCPLYGVDYDILLTIITFSSNYILITNLINLMLKKFTKLKYTIINIISIMISIIIFTLFVIIFVKLM